MMADWSVKAGFPSQVIVIPTETIQHDKSSLSAIDECFSTLAILSMKLTLLF